MNQHTFPRSPLSPNYGRSCVCLEYEDGEKLEQSYIIYRPGEKLLEHPALVKIIKPASLIGLVRVSSSNKSFSECVLEKMSKIPEVSPGTYLYYLYSDNAKYVYHASCFHEFPDLEKLPFPKDIVHVEPAPRRYLEHLPYVTASHASGAAPHYVYADSLPYDLKSIQS